MSQATEPRAQLPWTPTGVIGEGWNVVRRDPTLIVVAFAILAAADTALYLRLRGETPVSSPPGVPPQTPSVPGP